MGQETLLKTSELLKGKLRVERRAQTPPPVAGSSDPPSRADETPVDSGGKESHAQNPVEPPSFHSPSFSCQSPPEPVTADLIDHQEQGQSPPPDEVPSLSFSEPTCSVDPLRVGVPSSLDPDLYYTAPSTPVKMASRSSHLKHRSYPGSPACSLSPVLPSDSEDLCSPLTSPSGSYITAEGGSWTSSYTSSTSPSTSPNLLLTEEPQEAPACFVGSLSEIGDEAGEDKREGEKAADSAARPEASVVTPQVGSSGPEVLEEEQADKGDSVKVSREARPPPWVTRSSSGHSSDSQEDGGGSDRSLCPRDEVSARRAGYCRPLQTGLTLQLEACSPQGQAGDVTPDTENTPVASSSPDSPVVLDAFGRLGPGSFVFSQASSAEDVPDEDGMIPLSLLSFPLPTSLIFKADSMEITLFPTEEENEITTDRNEGTDAYAAGEEEADVEDDDNDDDDEEDEEDDDDYEEDESCDVNNNGPADGASGASGEALQEAQVEVEVEVVEEEEGYDVRALENPTDEDSSASFLRSLSETSINEGLDEFFCFQDDTDDSIDSTSYNGEEDERLYSTERHAQSLEPTSVDGGHSGPERGPDPGPGLTHLVDSPRGLETTQPPAHPPVLPKGSKTEPEPLASPKPSEPRRPPGLGDPSGTGHTEASTTNPHDQKSSTGPRGSSTDVNLNMCRLGDVCGSPSHGSNSLIALPGGSGSQPEISPSPPSTPSSPETVDRSRSVENTPKQSDERGGEEPSFQPERDSYKLLIKPRRLQPGSPTVGLSRFVLPKAPGKSDKAVKSSISREARTEPEPKSGSASAEPLGSESGMSDSGSGPDVGMSTGTNDLNKGVPLLSCPKETSPNLSNIPVCASPEVTSGLADNLVLTCGLCSGDSAQENLRENTLSADERALGAVGSPHSPPAISPKRENSETEIRRESGSGARAWCDAQMGLGSGVWGAGESLSVSLGKSCELLLCDTQTATMSSAGCENVLGSVVDEEDDNNLSGTSDRVSVGHRMSESNLSRWKSIEEISEAGGGEDGSSRFPDDDIGDVKRDNDTLQPNTGLHSALNALSGDVKPQYVCLADRDTLSNIPLEETDTTWKTSSEGRPSSSSVPRDKGLINLCPADKLRSTCPSTSPDRNTTLSLLHGSFGSCIPKFKSTEPKPSPACLDKVENIGPQSESEKVLEPPTEGPRSSDPSRGQQRVVSDSGKVDKSEETLETRVVEKAKKKKQRKAWTQNANEPSGHPTPQGEMSPDKPNAAKKRRRKQLEEGPLLSGGLGDAAPEMEGHQKKPDDSRTTSSQENNPPPPAPPQQRVSVDTQHDVRSPREGDGDSTDPTQRSVSVLKAPSRESGPKQGSDPRVELLDSRPAPPQRGGAPDIGDISDNNVKEGPPAHDTSPLLSSSAPTPPSAGPREALPVPVQESAPVLWTHRVTAAPLGPTPPSSLQSRPSQRPPNKASTALTTSAASATARTMPHAPPRPTQESSSHRSRVLHADPSSPPRAVSSSPSQPNANVQPEEPIRRSTRDGCRGGYLLCGNVLVSQG